MNFLQKIFKLSGTGFTDKQYYESMNLALKRLNNEYTMLHYPYYVNESDSFVQTQKNLTDHCISLLSPLENKKVLEIGCGNGVQAIYICSKYHPLSITGVDLNNANIDIANSERERVKMDNVSFHIDDAQNLIHIPSDSVDVVLNIESAFHYPDKAAFLKEIHRVLKPGGEFLVADLLSAWTKFERNVKTLGVQRVTHFWDQNRYEDEFQKSGLVITCREDITHEVSKGWDLYHKWMPKLKRKQFFQDLAYRIFYVINIRMNNYYLRHGQQYFIFVGQKPLSKNR